MRKGFLIQDKNLGWSFPSLFLKILLLAISTKVSAQPVPVASNSGPICTGGSLNLYETGTGAVSWLWSSNGSATFSSKIVQNPV
ncbi:MAG TPA: hypothetical protein PLR88_11280, partial [Bacteroidales bacterium]|nr:hypothetical protein [Bacteroidales bacterium]